MQERRPYSYRDDASVPAFADDRPIIVFDGECVFCSGWVKFVLHNDAAAHFRFATAQSLLGTALYRHYGLNARDYETNIVIENGQAFEKSEAALAVLAGIGRYGWLSSAARFVPLRLRDTIYDCVARNRYRIAGRRATCFVPTPEHRARFIG